MNLLGIESWLSIRQADALTGVQLCLQLFSTFYFYVLVM